MAKGFLERYKPGSSEPNTEAFKSAAQKVNKIRSVAVKFVEAEKRAFEERHTAKKGRSREVHFGPDDKGDQVFSPAFGSIQWKLYGDDQPNAIKTTANTDSAMNTLFEELIDAIKSGALDERLKVAYEKYESLPKTPRQSSTKSSAKTGQAGSTTGSSTSNPSHRTKP